MTVQLTVIGLNQVGVSIGLAIKAGNHPILRIGSDIDITTEQKALKLGAFDRVVHNLPSAVEQADIVVLSLPVDELRKTLEIIAPTLKPGVVILDTSPLKSAMQSWASSLLPEERYLLSFYPNINPEYLEEHGHGLEQAHADLFHNSLFLIGADEKTHPEAVKLAADFASLLGAKPYFSDFLEAEGLTSLIHHLTQVSAAALFHAIESQPGWLEAQKIAGAAYLGALLPLENLDEEKEFGEALLLNSQNSVRALDAFITEVQALREMIARQDAEALKSAFTAAVEGRNAWLKNRQSQSWEKSTAPELPTTGQWLGRLIGVSGKSLRDLDKPKK
jgi:prephenate dehydrogenase